MDREGGYITPVRVWVLQHNLRCTRSIPNEVRAMMSSRELKLQLVQEPYSTQGHIPGLGLATWMITEEAAIMAAIVFRNRDLSMVRIPHPCDTHMSCVHISAATETSTP